MPSAALRHEQKVCFLTWAARLSFALYHGPAWSLGDAEMFSPEGPELELQGERTLSRCLCLSGPFLGAWGSAFHSVRFLPRLQTSVSLAGSCNYHKSTLLQRLWAAVGTQNESWYHSVF